MPLLKPAIVDDPFASLAWNGSVSLLALEKLLASEPITDDERLSLTTTLGFLTSATTTSTAPPNDVLMMERASRNSFFLASFGTRPTAIRNQQGKPPANLPQIVTDLKAVIKQLEQSPHAKIDSELIQQAQEGCLAVVETANSCRPRRGEHSRHVFL